MIFVSILFVYVLYEYIRELPEDGTVVLKHVGGIKDSTFMYVEYAFSLFSKRKYVDIKFMK